MPSVRHNAWYALPLLLPAPTLGVLFGVILFPDTMVGKTLFFGAKGWTLLLPLCWQWYVVREAVPCFAPSGKGLMVGALLGLAMSGVVAVVYLGLGTRLIDVARIRAIAVEVGLDSVPIYVAGALYWTVVNALLEEYVWRWFVIQEAERLAGRAGAVILSALAFCVHHAVAMQAYCAWSTVAVAAFGIFIGAVVWSWCYLRYGTVWPGYLSHALVDATVFGLGYHLIFG